MAELGRQVKYGIGKGADITASNWINQLKFELNPKNEYIHNDSAYGVIEKTNDSTLNRLWSEGSLEAKMTADTGGLFLLGALGSVSSVDNADTNPIVKDHTFTINQDISGQLFTLIRKDGLTTEKFTSARFGEWELAMSLNDYVKFTAKVMAKKGVTTTATPAFETNPSEFVAKHISVKTGATEAAALAASAISNVESFTLNVDPNIEADWQAGSSDPAGFTGRGYDIKFEMTCRYLDTTFRDAYNAGTQLALNITATNTDVLIGAAANPKLVVTAPKMFITDWARSEDMNGPISQTMTGKINYSAVDARALKMVLTNVTASY